MLEYLAIMLIFTLPLILYAAYKRRFKALGLAALMGLAIGMPWDTISAGILKTWSWNEEQLIGVWIGWLPLEEYLFMVLVPMMLIGGALIFKIDLYICNNKE
ncbi:lycopene cyclase domain-containing protein [Candidatus Bathyarchaeota archaeon]|nr:lycopene cyclase domain-containing protein [Candidatus Bathyarchaeota archaeon]